MPSLPGSSSVSLLHDEHCESGDDVKDTATLLGSEEFHEKPKYRRHILLVSAMSSLATLLLMLGALFLLYQYSRGKPLQWEKAINEHRPGTMSCGDTRAEAIRRNCTFDELSMMWMPQRCTRDYNDEYRLSVNGTLPEYWTDRHARQPVSNPSTHIGGEDVLWTSRRNHIVHCQYNLYRLAKVLKSGDYMGQDFGGSLSDHMHHCVMVMAEFAMKAPAEQLDITDIIVEASLGYC